MGGRERQKQQCYRQEVCTKPLALFGEQQAGTELKEMEQRTAEGTSNRRVTESARCDLILFVCQCHATLKKHRKLGGQIVSLCWEDANRII